VSFFALVRPGRGASAVFGLRGPGLFVGGLEMLAGPEIGDDKEVVVMGFEDDEGDGVVSVGPDVVVPWACSVKGVIDGSIVETSAFSSEFTAGSFHRGHFFASVESSGTSITSLKGKHHQQRNDMKEV